MQVLFTTLFGSKLYGTDTPESDTDFKSVYLPPIGQLLRGDKIKNSVSSTGKAFEKNGAGDEDHETIPLQVLAKDFVKGQTYALEVVFNATQNPENVDPMFHKFCVELSEQFLTRNVRAMVGYALNQANKYGIKGTRLNSLLLFRALLASCDMPMEAKLQDAPDWNSKVALLASENKHIEVVLYNGPTTKDPSDLKDLAVNVLEKTYGYEITFEEAFKRVNNGLAKYGARSEQAMSQSGHDWKAISHALRIIDQAIDVLTNHRLVFPLPDADYYRQVKVGEVDWESVSERLSERLELLEELQKTTSLPDADAAFNAQFYEWFDNKLSEIYDVK